MKEDIKAVDRGEANSDMEPLLIGDSSRHRGGLTDLAFDLTQKSAGSGEACRKACLVRSPNWFER